MYLKIIGTLFLIGASASIGFLKAEELKERVRKLQELKRMMILLQGEFRFHRATLAEAFENVAGRVDEPFHHFLLETAKKLEERDGNNFEMIWNKRTEELLYLDGLKKEDAHLFELLGNSLGYLDLTMQTETLNQAIFRVEEVLEIAKEQMIRKGKLYQTMGVTIGALLTLLII